MDLSECTRLQTYLRTLLGARELEVAASGQDAVLKKGGASLGDIIRDEDEGELSYCLSINVARAKGAKKNAPIDADERELIEGVLSEKLGAEALSVRARPRKTDSAEVYVGEEFIGTLSADEDEGLFLTVSILDIDLEENA